MKLLSLLVFCLFFGALHAQKPCEKFSIYFDLNESNLTNQSTKTLNKLAKTLKGTGSLIELYGFADSTASDQYNLALSQKRIDSVKAFLNKIETINFSYFERNLGEDDQASDLKDLALSRRVDLFILPMKGDKIVIPDGAAEVAVPKDYFEPCGVCQSRPKINAFYTEEEAAQANIAFETNEGIPLISAGTFDFNFTPCDESKATREKVPLCYNIRSSQIDAEMLLWAPDTINGVIYWKPMDITPEFDTVNNVYRFCTTDRMLNLDKPKEPYPASIYFFPSELVDIRSDFFRANEIESTKSTEDSVSLSPSLRYHTAASVGQIGNTFYHFKRRLSDFPPIDTIWFNSNKKERPTAYTFQVELDQYEKLIFSDSDTTLMVKLKNNPIQVGYYLKDVQLFIPFEWNKKRKRFYGQKPTGEYELAYTKRRNKVYVLPKEKTEIKYKRFRKMYKLKLRKKHTKWFKRDKTYPTKRGEWDKFLNKKQKA